MSDERDDDLVQVTVPTGFTLRLHLDQVHPTWQPPSDPDPVHRDHRVVRIKAGTTQLPRAYAEHPYSQDNGVVVVES